MTKKLQGHSGTEPSDFVKEGHALRIFKNYIPDTSSRILDIGCADGFFLRQMQKEEYNNLFGSDIFDYHVDEFKGMEVKRCDFCLEKLPWPDNYFDVITGWETMEHLENPYFFIKEAYRVLKPGGYFFISMPNVFHITSKIMFLRKGDFPRWTKTNGHINVFTNNIFKKAFLHLFHLESRRYYSAELSQGLRGRMITALKFLDNYLPETEAFSRFVVYVLKK